MKTSNSVTSNPLMILVTLQTVKMIQKTVICLNSSILHRLQWEIPSVRRMHIKGTHLDSNCVTDFEETLLSGYANNLWIRGFKMNLHVVIVHVQRMQELSINRSLNFVKGGLHNIRNFA